MRQIYRRTPMLKCNLLCNFIEITLQYGCSPVNCAYFHNIFSWKHLCRAASIFRTLSIIMSESFCENRSILLAITFFGKKFYHRFLTGSWIRLCNTCNTVAISATYEMPSTEVCTVVCLTVDAGYKYFSIYILSIYWCTSIYIMSISASKSVVPNKISL